MDDYKPVACELHSEFELAIMQARPVSVRWLDSQGKTQEGTVWPLDVFARQGEEFLTVRNGDAVENIRLDRILAFQPEPLPR